MAHRRSRRRARKRHALVQRIVAACAVAAALLVIGYVAISLSPGWRLSGDRVVDSTRWATVATDGLNVRESPSTASAVLDTFEEGRTVEVLGEPESGFVPVRYGEQRAWMAGQYLAFQGDTLAQTNPVQVADVSAAEAVASVPESADNSTSTVAGKDPAEQAPDPVQEAPSAEPGERWIDIDRSTATVTLYEGAVAIDSFSGKIGRDPATDGYYSTAVGTYHVYSMNKGLASTPFADDTYLTDWVGFDPDRKNGIHSPVRDAFGNEKEWQNPSTLGCVRLGAVAAVTVFEFAEMGMRVEVHD